MLLLTKDTTIEDLATAPVLSIDLYEETPMLFDPCWAQYHAADSHNPPRATFNGVCAVRAHADATGAWDGALQLHLWPVRPLAPVVRVSPGSCPLCFSMRAHYASQVALSWPQAKLWHKSLYGCEVNKDWKPSPAWDYSLCDYNPQRHALWLLCAADPSNPTWQRLVKRTVEIDFMCITRTGTLKLSSLTAGIVTEPVRQMYNTCGNAGTHPMMWVRLDFPPSNPLTRTLPELFT